MPFRLKQNCMLKHYRERQFVPPTSHSVNLKHTSCRTPFPHLPSPTETLRCDFCWITVTFPSGALLFKPQVVLWPVERTYICSQWYMPCFIIGFLKLLEMVSVVGVWKERCWEVCSLRLRNWLNLKLQMLIRLHQLKLTQN